MATAVDVLTGSTGLASDVEVFSRLLLGVVSAWLAGDGGKVP